MAESHKCHVLNSLCLKFKDYQSTFLTVEDLRLLGIKASQVGISDGKLQFDPCFFQPHTEKVLQKYPIGKPKNLPELENPPTLDDFLERAKKISEEKEPLTIAKSMHKEYYAESAIYECYENALQVYRYVDSQLYHLRRRNPNDENFRDWFYFSELQDFEFFKYVDGQGPQ